MEWTKEQLLAIQEKDNNILVSAAAGSGKTAVLVERIIRKLINEKIDIDKLLVVTFTNAAASQIKEKIIEAIYKKLETDPENSHLQKQISLMSRASISTIHSFCLEIIRNHFYEIGISPNFRIGDTSEIELIKQETIDDLFEEKYEEKDDEFNKLIECFTSYHGDDDLKELVFRIDRFIKSTPFPEEWLINAVNSFNIDKKSVLDFSHCLWGKILLDTLKQEAESYSIELKSIEKKLYEEGLTKFAQTISDDIRIISEFISIQNWEDAHIKANAISFLNWPIDKKTISNLKEEAKAKRSKIKDDFLKSIDYIKMYSSEEAIDDIKYMQGILDALKNLVLSFEEKFQESKLKKNVIDFNDIEHFALKLLIKKDSSMQYVETDVAKEYKEKYVEIAIDEYQDSNLIQDYILRTISKNNNIFMVGDVKQSIYKFRQAMPKLFIDKFENYNFKEEAKEQSKGIKIVLSKNFRSREEVLKTANQVFQAIMSKQIGDVDYSNQDYLNAGAVFEKPKNDINYAGKPELHIIDIKTDDVEIEDLPDNISLEAEYVAKRINELINSNYQVFDKSGYRKATYKDFVILLRTTNNVAQIFEKELMLRDIPVYSDMSSEYIKSTEIETILSLLKIIDNPNQDIALVTILRSPIYHFDDNELINIRLADRNGTFYEALQKARDEIKGSLKDKIDSFLNQIELFREKQEYMPLNEFIWYIYEETGYSSYIMLTPNGALKMANLKMLFQRAKDYESASFKGLYNFVNYIERMKKSNQDFGAAKIIGESENVVRIMSIHKSKGLEFPIVFICGTGKGFNFRDLNERVLLHNDIGFGPKYINYSRQIEYDTLAKEAVKQVSRREEVSEEMRILYVALTRAKEKVIIVGNQKDAYKKINEKEELLCDYNENKLPAQIVNSYKTYLDWLELVYIKTKNEGDEAFSIHIHNPKDVENEIKQDEEKKVSVAISKELKNEIKKQIEWKYAKKELATIASKSSVTELESKKSDEQVRSIKCEIEIPEFLKDEKKITNAQKGTIMHLVLQKLDLKREYTNEELQDFVQYLVKEGLLTEQESKLVNLAKIEGFLNSNLAKDIRHAKRIYQEKPFYMYIPAREIYDVDFDEKIVVQGIIDLYYINDEGKIVLVDYKTDFVEDGKEEELINKYKTQIKTYKKAIEQAAGKTVDNCYIYSLYLNKEIKIM